MKFKINQEIFEKYPDLIEAVVILQEIDNSIDGSEILRILRNHEEEKRKEFEHQTLADHPKIKPWREAFRDFGSKPNQYSSSVEALLKRVLKGDNLPDINPLVNLYNYCSIKHILPFGGEDFSGVFGDLELKYSNGSEEFIPIMSKINDSADLKEVVWCDDQGVTCRKWNWRQCDRTKVTESTKSGYFIIDGLNSSTKQEIEQSANELISLASKYLGAKAKVLWLDKNNQEAEVDIETKIKTEKDNKHIQNKNQNKTNQNKIEKFERNYRSLPFKGEIDDIELNKILKTIIANALGKSNLEIDLNQIVIHVEHPQEENHGDFSTNIAFVLAGRLKKNPNEIANEIAKHINNPEYIENIEVIKGFINFRLSQKFLSQKIKEIIDQKNNYGVGTKKNKRMIIEFGQPNTHKMPHIGHLFSYTLGESLARILEFSGFEIFRANYQGDVGPHVAKCIWAYIKNNPETPDSYRQKAELLQKMYQQGATAYKEDENVKTEIDEINKKIYLEDPEIYPIYEKTREWSIGYYLEFEKMIKAKYHKYYFESQTFDPGKKIVLDNVGNIFKKSEGAIIFPGSEYTLHDRVFVTKNNTPTYEAKDMALQPMKYKDWPFDFMIIMTAHEQNEYFNVVFKALEMLDSTFQGRLMHLGFGMVNLASGKMSSRTGNIITGIGLIEKSIELVSELVEERENLSETEKNEIAHKVGIGAVKYSLLKTNPFQDVKFSFEESLSFEGDSGPYLQYTYARALSIINGLDIEESKILPEDIYTNQEEEDIARTLYKFPEVVHEAGLNLSPYLICNFLFDLAQKFNTFYRKHKVLSAETEELKVSRIFLTKAVVQILENGLNLLGIDILEKM